MKKKIGYTIAAAGFLLALASCANGNAATVPPETPPAVETASAEPMPTATPTPMPTHSETADDTQEAFVLETMREKVMFGDFIHLYDFSYYIQPKGLPENLAGKVFSKSGRALTAYPEGSVAYDENGKQGLIILVGEEPWLFVPTDFVPADFDEEIVEAAQIFCDEMYYPAYIPEGYPIREINNYNANGDSAGTSKYKNIDFKKDHAEDGKKPDAIHLLMRYMDKDTAYGDGSNANPAQFVTINGHRAFLVGRSVTMLVGDVEYVIGGTAISLEEALNMAYSLALVEEPKGFVLETVVEEMGFSKFIHSTKYLHYVDPAVLPENLKGQVYSKSGNALTAYPAGGIAYDANGKEGLILLVGEEPEFFVPYDFAPADFSEEIVKAAAIFYDDMYYPAYIPAGYSLSSHSLTEHEDFDTDSGAAGIVKYNIIKYTKPAEDESKKPYRLDLLLRFMDAETAYDGGQSPVPSQFANINGHTVIIDKSNVSLMIGDVNYSIGGTEITLHDMLNMVYSLTLVEE